MNIEYLLLLVCITLVPALMSRSPNLPLTSGKGALTRAMLSVSVFFWCWDIIATARGHWWFNEEYVLGIGLLGLPLEEWLFFPAIAFVSVFTWESTKYFMRRR